MKSPPWLHVEGDTDYRGDCPPEAAEQVTFFNWIRREFPDTYGRIALHPRNEGKRTAQQASREKSEGMTAGAPDVFIPCSPPIIIELKRRDHTKSAWQPGQIEYLEAAQNLGAIVCVALGWEAAKNFFLKTIDKKI